MEITNEVKEKVFAPYILQKVLWMGHKLVVLDKTWNWLHPSAKLKLKPISAISDEYAYGLCDIIGAFTADNFLNGLQKGVYVTDIHKAINAYQYLISKGYDMPSYHLGGKTLQECGLAIYE